MPRVVTALLVSVCCLGLFAAPAFAWNDTGHMAVAYIAYKHLTPQAREAVDRLVALNPDVAAWSNALPASWDEDTRRLARFMFISIWPDLIKSKDTYVSDGPAGGNEPPPVPESSQNIGYSDKLRHKYWHFVDHPFSTDQTPVAQPPVPNAESQLAILRTAFADPQTSDDVRAYDLTWIVHLVGDLHQPLHTVSRFSKGHPKGDDGGNVVMLCTAPCKANLHGFWDSVLGAGFIDVTISLGEALDAIPFPSATAKSDTTDTAKWIAEGVAAAKTVVYSAPIKPESPAPAVSLPSRAYRTKARVLAEDRVILAGRRLARLINEALK
jgi:hypothetical protein